MNWVRKKLFEKAGYGKATVMPRIIDKDGQPADFSGTLPLLPGEISFTVSAVGEDISYQWQASDDGETWSDISGATEATCTLEVKSTNLASIKKYIRAALTAGDNTRYSNAASVTVKNVYFSKQPGDQYWDGQSSTKVTFSVTAVGQGGITRYQWQRKKKSGGSWANVGTGQTLTEYGSTAVTYNYRCDAISGAGGHATSNTCTATIA